MLPQVDQETAQENWSRPGTFELYRSGLFRQWRWRYRANNGRVVFASTESYWNKRDCLTGIPRCSTVANARRKQL